IAISITVITTVVWARAIAAVTVIAISITVVTVITTVVWARAIAAVTIIVVVSNDIVFDAVGVISTA
ncbi:hypothetical protein P5E51_15885, partial [Clostridium perfringens]|nr:hypothetical protein [Clostridium perfringens]